MWSLINLKVSCLLLPIIDRNPKYLSVPRAWQTQKWWQWGSWDYLEYYDYKIILIFFKLIAYPKASFTHLLWCWHGLNNAISQPPLLFKYDHHQIFASWSNDATCSFTLHGLILILLSFLTDPITSWSCLPLSKPNF